MSDLDLNLDDLAAFVQVVESGGFTAAARVLDRSTKQVSRQVRRLEAHVDVRLLNRTTRAVSLTDPGERFYAHALRILDDVRAAQAELRSDDGRLEGRLRVVLPTIVAVAGLSSWLAALRDRHPGLALEVRLADHPIDLVAEGLDLQVTSGVPTQTSVLARRAFTVALPLAAHESYLATHPAPATPEQLANHECLLFVADRPQHTWPLVDAKGTTQTIQVSGSLQSSSSEVLFSALVAGLGIGICGSAWLSSGEHPGLVRVLPDWTFAPMPLYVVVPPANRRSALVEAFLDVIIDGLRRWV